MHPLAATATPTTAADGSLLGFLITMAIVVTLGYAIGCWLWPFAACRRCQGYGRRRSPFGRAFGDCRRCNGTGRSLRISRRILNSLRELPDKGTK